jgi:hypothetical protein
MELRTATLLAIIGIALHFLIHLGAQAYTFVEFGFQDYAVFDFHFIFTMAIHTIGTALLDGSLILFLSIFYTKQRPRKSQINPYASSQIEN